MEHRYLGTSGFKVPALGFGAGTFGGEGRCSAPGATPTSTRRAASSTSASTPASTCSTPPTSIRAAPPKRSSARRIKGRRDKVILSTKTALPLATGRTTPAPRAIT